MPTARYDGRIALDWRSDPSLVPDAAVHSTDILGLPRNPYQSLVEWTLSRFIDNTGDKTNELDYADIFTKYKLPNHERLATRQVLRQLADMAYGPGIDFMAKVHEVVPPVALGAGVSDRGDWVRIAADARHFARHAALDGTIVQFLVRAYLGSDADYKSMDPTKFRTDEDTGITTVTPIESLVAAAKATDARFNLRYADHSGVCAAMQTRVAEMEEEVSMYDAVWQAFSTVVGDKIYPFIEVEPAVPNEPDPFYTIQMDVMGLQCSQEQYPAGAPARV
jgi:hypothetical protein